MKRTQISLTEEERLLLDRVVAQTGRSLSSLIREAVTKTYGAERSREEDLAALREGFGSWQDREEDGEAYVERLRSGRRLQDVL